MDDKSDRFKLANLSPLQSLKSGFPAHLGDRITPKNTVKKRPAPAGQIPDLI
jgi:hypothetical protein